MSAFGPVRTVLRAVLMFATGVVAAPAGAVDFFVNSTLDQIDDEGLDGVCHTVANTCTLRAAVMQANRTGGSVRIYLSAGTYTLTRPPDAANGDDSGDLNFSTNPASYTQIFGAGAGSTIIDANQLDRAFRVEANRGAALWYLTVRNGLTSSLGGGIRVEGALTLFSVEVRENHAAAGGGVWGADSSIVQLFGSTVRSNLAGDGGGVLGGGTLIFRSSTISDNTATGNGGGVFSPLGFQAVDSTISGNTSAGSGGGAFVDSSGLGIEVVSSTVSGNRTDGSGGGIALLGGTANVYSSTMVFNRADWDVDATGQGGGFFVDAAATVNIRNCLIAGNSIFGSPSIPNDCNGTVNFYGRNLFGTTVDCVNLSGTGSGEFVNDLTLIAPLSKHGGPTKTHALLPGSNAIDYADPIDGCLSPSGVLVADQRGAPRALGLWCDIGAYESEALFLDAFESGDLSAWPP